MKTQNKTENKTAANTTPVNAVAPRKESTQVHVEATYIGSKTKTDEERAKLLAAPLSLRQFMAAAVAAGKFTCIPLHNGSTSGSLTGTVEMKAGDLQVNTRFTIIGSAGITVERARLAAKLPEGKVLGLDATVAIGNAVKLGLFDAVQGRTSAAGNVTHSVPFKCTPKTVATDPVVKVEATPEQKQEQALAGLLAGLR